MREPNDLNAEEQVAIAQVGQACQEIAMAYRLAQGAGVTRLAGRSSASGLAELRSFADGLQQDRAAVTAGLSLPWTSGQTEGQINRLKLVKRTMYGRAKFPLRQRVPVPI